MDIAKIARLMPLLTLGVKKAGELTSEDIAAVTKALSGGEENNSLLQLLLDLREKEPDVLGARILASPTAQDMIAQMLSQEAEPEPHFARCPCCNSVFETNFN